MTTTPSSFSNTASHTIDAFTLKEWMNQESVTLVDVREPAEYAGEHIVGATLVSLSKFNSNKIPRNSDTKVVLYCRSGSRSAKALQKLRNENFDEVFDLKGGITAWKEAGYPTQINKSAPISLMRQVQIVAGTLILLGTGLGAFVSPWFLLLSGFVGAGFLMAGITDTCLMARLLSRLPYNQRI
ncbi:MAG: rhodanese-like domain-containing protein [Halothece sp.]